MAVDSGAECNSGGPHWKRRSLWQRSERCATQTVLGKPRWFGDGFAGGGRV